MKTNNLNRIYLTTALLLMLSSGAEAQTAIAPSQPISGGPITVGSNPAQPETPRPLSDTTKEVPSPDSVLNKLKQNTSPVTINDMIAAQDVITRLDLIGQIEDKMAKIDDARAKHTSNTIGALSSTSLAGGQSPLGNAAAIGALQQAMPHGYSGYGAQVLAISGANGEYAALLQVDGHQLSVQPGSTVPGVGVVSSINARSVTVTKPNGKITDISFTQN